LFSQFNKEKQNLFDITFYSGYNTFDLKEVKNRFKEIADIYNTNDIPIPVQENYPNNYLIGIAAYKRFSNKYALGLNCYSSRTAAYSLYSDFAGDISIKSKLYITNIQLNFRYYPIENISIQPFLSISLGYLLTDFFLKEQISINDINYKSQYKITGKDNLLNLELYAGVEYTFFSFFLSPNIGYRFMLDDKIDFKLENTSVRYNNYSFVSLDVSGLLIILEIGYKI
jgi:hypothetical protein